MAETTWYTEEQVQNIRKESYAKGFEQVRDTYLSQISDESLTVLEKFGAEAPKLLNDYACAVEDALVEEVSRHQETKTKLEAAQKLLGIFNKEPEEEKEKEEPQEFRMAGKLASYGKV